MDYYTNHLLGMAYEKCQAVGFFPHDEGFGVEGERRDNGTIRFARGKTLAEALTALLTDLGETVPARPSAERVEKARQWATLRYEPEDQDLRADVIEFLDYLVCDHCGHRVLVKR